MRIALVGNTQAQAARLEALLRFSAEIVLDDETRATRTTPLEVDAAVSIRFASTDIAAIHCRLLQCSGAGIDGIALAELPRDTIVCNVHEHEIPVAEYVLASILEHEIGLSRAAAGFSGEHWGDLFRQRALHGEIAGKTMVVVGFGRIGKAIAVRASAFGVRVIAVTRAGRPAAEADATYPVGQLAAALSEADYLVLACPLTDATRGLIDAAALAQLPPTALLVNVARGAVVDEAALWAALQAHRLGGAVLDTWYDYPRPGEPNPRPSRFPFESLPNVRCTPHIAGWTEGLTDRRYRAIADNLARFNDGRRLRNVVWRDGAPAEGEAA